MKKRSKVTRTEWTVLEALWAEAPLSAREVYDRVKRTHKAGLQTVRTLLERLLDKGVVRRFDAHGVWVFEPARSREEVVREEGRSFLQRCFGGRPELGAAYFIESEQLPAEELKRLKKLLDTKLKEAKNE